jgi:crotonobetainyl-CoA:carnitine CoA-transferase CaiB-like acyl-CoA transferase
MPLLDGLRVLDFSVEIAGAYATKLLGDAGADVIKVESAEGDPLRRWSASGLRPRDSDGALFRFLAAGKRSIVGTPDDPALAGLITDADLVVESGQLTDDEVRVLRARHDDLVVVSVTPFGRTGPWANRPATEFTLQAWCGSIASRGTLDRPPLHVGGRLGEWIAGTYTAVAALGAVHAGHGEHVDVSMLECMAGPLGGLAVLHASLAGLDRRTIDVDLPSRTVEVPSIARTRDGLVGFTTITGQQFEDFLLMIGRPELRGDERYATAMRRTKHADEFSAMVEAWTSTQTTEEVIEMATALRIPVAPIGTPGTIPSIEHFAERGVYHRSADGDFLAPRPPYRVEGVDAPDPRAAPLLGEHAGDTWLSRPATARTTRTGPLEGIRVVDLTAFWAGPSGTQVLAAFGADVVKVESVQRPDGMRFQSTKPPSEAHWWEWSAVFQAVNTDKGSVTLDLGSAEGSRLLERLIADADLVVENFTPRVLDNFGFTWERVHEINPRTCLVRMPAFGLTGPWRDRTGFAQTMEQLSGMAWLTGFPDGLPMIPRGACDPLVGMHAAFAVMAALTERDRSGVGRFIEITMVEAALNVAAELVIEQTAYGAELTRAGNRGPVAAPQGVYRCRGRDRWLALAVVDDAHWTALTQVMSLGALAGRTDLDAAAGRRAAADEIDEAIAAAVAEADVEVLTAALLDAGIPAAVVTPALFVIDGPQAVARGFGERIEHPIIGSHDLYGLPFRFASRPGPWFSRHAPLLGESNAAILGGELGLDAAELHRLTEHAVIGDRPAGGSVRPSA